MERKVKYTYKFKLHCVYEVLRKNQSIKSVAKGGDVHLSQLKRWINIYHQQGYRGLIPRQNQFYTVDFKLNVLNSVSKKFLSLNEACLEFNIPSYSTIITWQQRFDKFGIEGLSNKPRGRPKIMTYKRTKKKSDKPLTREEELLLEIESLRAENALLKKLQALIQAEQNKKHKP